MSLNVLVGAEDRLDAICTLLSALRPDVLVLQECLGWEDGTQLRAVARALGVPDGEPHVLLGAANPRPSGRRYHVALVSRAPIVRRRVHTQNLAHCIVEAELDLGGQPLVVLGAHFVSSNEEARLTEAAELLRIVPPETLRTGAYLLAGDLNALSRHDPYPADLDDHLTRAGIDKYGHPPRFEVIDELLAAGFLDALRARPRSKQWVTARREARGQVVDTRTDYLLLTALLARRLDFAEVIDVGQASDHHAVLAELA